MAIFERRRIRRLRDGTVKVELTPNERTLLANVAAELSGLLSDAGARDRDPSMTRLYPNAYTDRPDLDDEFRRLMTGDLTDRHRWALDTLAASVDAEVIDDEQLGAWTSAVNQVRLVLGSRIGVTEELDDLADDDPAAEAFAVYQYLSWLLDQLVMAHDLGDEG